MAHVMKECGTYVVKMSKKSKETPTQLVVPHLKIKSNKYQQIKILIKKTLYDKVTLVDVLNEL